VTELTAPKALLLFVLACLLIGVELAFLGPSS